MRRALLLAALAASSLLPSPGLVAGDGGGRALVPADIPPEDYKPIWTRSPFSSLPASAETGDSGGWALAGLVRNGDSPTVFLVNKQTQERITVTSQPNAKGFSVESIDTRPNLLQSSARIKTPGESLLVKFDASALAAAAAASPAPTVPPAPQGKPLPAPLPFLPVPPAQQGAGAPPSAPARIIVPPTAIPNPLPVPAP